MTKTEGLFAAILLLAIVAAVALVVFRSDGGTAVARSNYGVQTADVTFVGFTGSRDTDLCTCYEKAYEYGSRTFSIEGVEYKGGYSECSNRWGEEGGNAWTWGWLNGQQGPNTPKTCRAFYATHRSARY